ncbi:MAG: hypothetical protein ACLP9D_16230, partial [Candidatus Bathyarchaeia archaeon]
MLVARIFAPICLPVNKFSWAALPDTPSPGLILDLVEAKALVWVVGVQDPPYAPTNIARGPIAV